MSTVRIPSVRLDAVRAGDQQALLEALLAVVSSWFYPPRSPIADKPASPATETAVDPVGRGKEQGGQAMNAFTAPMRPSIATHLKPPRILKSVDRNPRYHGYYIESGAKAQESTLKTQRILKGALR